MPIPLSVICSPSHIRNAVPAVSVSTVINLKDQPGKSTMASPAGPFIDSSPMPIIVPCTRLKTTVKYLVYWVMVFLPDSPSFESRSRCGTTTVSSCNMMDALIYGMMPSEKTEKRSSAPPVNIVAKSRRVPLEALKKPANASASMPGVGMNTPILKMASRTNVIIILRFNSGSLLDFGVDDAN